ncbi:MAG: glycosyltransferase family 4 protein [Anaerolineales bacterium]
MRVGYVLASLQNPSGWRTHAISLLHALQPEIQATLFVSASEVKLAQEEFPQFSIITLPTTQQLFISKPANWGKLWATYQQIKSLALPLDLIHSLEAYPSGLIGHWISQQLHCPHLLTAHGTYGIIAYATLLDRLAYQSVLRKAAMICPVSHATAQRIQQYFKQSLQQTPIQPILNGNDFVQRVPRQQAWQRQLPETPTLLSVGDVKARKGQHISLQVFARLQEMLPDIRYHIVGKCPDNPYTRQLKHFVEERGLRNVTFYGAISDEELAEQYRQASLFILTPQEGQAAERWHFEGFGLVYLEAGAYGVPVIASRSGGVSDAVKDGETGFILDPDDIEGMVQASLRLLGDVQLNQQMGRANRAYAETRTWQRCAEEYLQVYRRVVKQ